MKKMRRAAALMLALIMVLSMGICASADENDGQGGSGETPVSYSITVTNDNTAMSIVGKTYQAFKLFDVTYSGTNYAYTIKTTNPFYSNAAAKAVLDQYFDFGDIASDATTKNVTVETTKQDPTTKTLTAADVRKLADELQPYATGTPAGQATASSESVTINLSEAGFYVVTGTVKPTDPANSDKEVVSAVILDNADPTANVKPKASVPTIDKKITAVTDNGQILDSDGQAAVAKVGQTVSYQIDSVVPDLTGYSNYTFTIGDALSNGLDYVSSSFVLTINGATESIVPEITGRSFTLTIPYNTLKKYTKGDAIILTYNCTVNENALTYDYENNTAKLTYSKSPYTNETNETPEKKTYVIDLNLDVLKIDGATKTEQNPTKLDGAKFKLYREVTTDGTTTKEFYKWADNKVTWTTEADADVFETDSNGKLKQQVRGLDRGTYYLLETKAPTGFNALKDPVEIIISVSEADNKVTYTATYGGEAAAMTNGTVDLATAQASAQPVATGTISNEHGVELPSTGGIGTTLFYIVGAVLVIGAGVLLVTRRRMDKK